MSQSEKNFCFCTLALGERYRLMTRDLATDIAKHSPGTTLLVFTDQPETLKDCQNVLAYKHRQYGIQRCSNDRRFLVEKALSMFPLAIHIDADTRLVADVPEPINPPSGIAGRYENLLEHVSKNRPDRVEIVKTVARKLDIPIEKANWIGESLYMIPRDGGREKEFLELWGRIGSYVELQGMHGGDGNVMGLAAAKVGWTVERTQSWEAINQIREHLDASHQKKKKTFWDNLQRRLGYHRRLNRARLEALKDFDFYYR